MTDQQNAVKLLNEPPKIEKEEQKEKAPPIELEEVTSKPAENAEIEEIAVVNEERPKLNRKSPRPKMIVTPPSDDTSLDKIDDENGCCCSVI